MTNLEQSRKHAAQLKDTPRKERDERNKLKRKFEDMRNEVKSSKAELQSLQETRCLSKLPLKRQGEMLRIS